MTFKDHLKFNIYAYLCSISCSLYITYCIQYVTYTYTYLLSVRFAASLWEVYIATLKSPEIKTLYVFPCQDWDRVYGADVFLLDLWMDAGFSLCRCWWWNDRIAPYGPPYVPNLWVQIHSGAWNGNFLCWKPLKLVVIPQASGRCFFFPAFHRSCGRVVVTYIAVICDRDSRCCPPAETCTPMAYHVCICGLIFLLSQASSGAKCHKTCRRSLGSWWLFLCLQLSSPFFSWNLVGLEMTWVVYLCQMSAMDLMWSFDACRIKSGAKWTHCFISPESWVFEGPALASYSLACAPRNLLIAQLNQAYQVVYEDMQGFARMLPSCPRCLGVARSQKGWNVLDFRTCAWRTDREL